MSTDWIPVGAARAINVKERGNRGLFPSSKVLGGIVEYESCLERDFFFLCQHAPDVVKIQHQPISITYQDEKQTTRKYTPDVYVEFWGGLKCLFEIKYEEEVLEKGEKYAERWSAAREWGKTQNISFSVLTEKDIRTPRWFNIWFTLGASKCVPDSSHLSKLNQVVTHSGERYDEICYLLSEDAGIEVNKAAQVLCYAIYHGLVFLDSFSTREIANDSIVRKKKRETKLPFTLLREELLGKNLANFGEERGIKENSEAPDQEPMLEKFAFKIPQKYEEITNFKLRMVKLWLSQPKAKRTKEWREVFCNKWGVSIRSLYYWVGAYQKGGIGEIIPKHDRAGRQTKFDSLTTDLMEKSRQYFLGPLVTQKKAYAKLGKMCEEQEITTPKFSSFRSFIYANTTAADFARKRGKKYFKSHFSPALASFQGALAPMQVVQMDNTSFDVFPVDSEAREGLATPNLTVAIDCYSRMVAGFNVSFFPSSAQSVLDVLVQSILPKETYANAYVTQYGWPIQGFPVLILVDNGMDFRSQALQDFCVKYDIIIEYAPVRTPRFKAFVEQWFNVLHKALVNEGVPGLRPLLKYRLENPDLKPEAEAVLTLQEIEDWLHKWVVDEYHFTNPYDDRAPAPYLRWQDYKSGHTNVLLPLPREPPVDPQEVDLLNLSTLERTEKVLSYEGVVWHHLRYNNKELVAVYNQFGRQKVEVLLNYRDIRCAWVVPTQTQKPIKVELASGWAQAMVKLYGDKPVHASAWDRDVKILREHLKNRISPYIYLKELSRMMREELLKTAEKTTKTTRKQSERTREVERKSIATKLQQISTPPSEIPEECEMGEGDGENDEEVEPFPTEWEIVKKKMIYSNIGAGRDENEGAP
jgi:putative transposase